MSETLIHTAQLVFREFNALEEKADIELCRSIFIGLGLYFNDINLFNRVRTDTAEHIYVALPKEQLLIIVIFRGQITMWVYLKHNYYELQEKYKLDSYLDEKLGFTYVGRLFVESPEQTIEEIKFLVATFVYSVDHQTT